MSPKTITLRRWHYAPPEPLADRRGNTVLLTEAAFDPAEACEWGLDAQGRPYRQYVYGEDMFYAESTEFRRITAEELRGKLEETARFMREHGHPDFADKLEQSLTRVK